MHSLLVVSVVIDAELSRERTTIRSPATAIERRLKLLDARSPNQIKLVVKTK
jgi:hypothetical protein